MLGALRVMPKVAAAGPPVDGYAAWYDASDTATITSSGGLTTQWADKGPSGYHLTASGATRPTTGTRTVNGLNVLDFDGSGNFMTSTLTGSQPHTIYVVFEIDSVATEQFMIDTAAGNRAAMLRDGGTGKWALYGGGYGRSSVTATTGLHFMCGVFNGTSSVLQINGTSDTVNASTNNYTAFEVGNYFGGGFNFNGAMCEIAAYSGAHDATQRASMRTAWQTKWGTP